MGTIATARRMRKAMSPPEARLWVALRKLRADGFHFRRQHPMLGYYPDFICIDRRLIVEVDGRGHDLNSDWDQRRDETLAREGIRTLRFTNVAIRDDIDWVMIQIHEALLSAAPTRPLHGPPPRDGEGD